MDNSIIFSAMIDKLTIIITNLNIEISKNPKDMRLQEKLKDVIADRELLYKGSISDLENIIAKYGEEYSE